MIAVNKQCFGIMARILDDAVYCQSGLSSRSFSIDKTKVPEGKTTIQHGIQPWASSGKRESRLSQGLPQSIDKRYHHSRVSLNA